MMIGVVGLRGAAGGWPRLDLLFSRAAERLLSVRGLLLHLHHLGVALPGMFVLSLSTAKRTRQHFISVGAQRIAEAQAGGEGGILEVLCTSNVTIADCESGRAGESRLHTSPRQLVLITGELRLCLARRRLRFPRFLRG